MWSGLWTVDKDSCVGCERGVVEKVPSYWINDSHVGVAGARISHQAAIGAGAAGAFPQPHM